MGLPAILISRSKSPPSFPARLAYSFYKTMVFWKFILIVTMRNVISEVQAITRRKIVGMISLPYWSTYWHRFLLTPTCPSNSLWQRRLRFHGLLLEYPETAHSVTFAPTKKFSSALSWNQVNYYTQFLAGLATNWWLQVQPPDGCLIFWEHTHTMPETYRFGHPALVTQSPSFF